MVLLLAGHIGPVGLVSLVGLVGLVSLGPAVLAQWEVVQAFPVRPCPCVEESPCCLQKDLFVEVSRSIPPWHGAHWPLWGEHVHEDDSDNYDDDDNDGDIGDQTITISMIMKKERIIKMMMMMMLTPAEGHTTVPSILPTTSSGEGAGTEGQVSTFMMILIISCILCITSCPGKG